MKLKRAVLEAMDREALKAAVDSLQLADVDRRSAKAMRTRLSRTRRATPDALLAKLRVADVRRVCELQELPASGRRQVLIERLLKQPQPSASRKPTATTADAGDAKQPASHRNQSATARPAPDNGATIGYEAQLWQAANALRGNMDAAEYKHVVLGIVFLKYISDAFKERKAQLEAERYADPEDPDEYAARDVFWVPL